MDQTPSHTASIMEQDQPTVRAEDYVNGPYRFIIRPSKTLVIYSL